MVQLSLRVKKGGGAVTSGVHGPVGYAYTPLVSVPREGSDDHFPGPGGYADMLGCCAPCVAWEFLGFSGSEWATTIMMMI